MYIDLSWTNVNAGPVTTKVYRGTNELDRANLSNPIVTLTNGETTYRDTGVLAGTTYYYVLEFSANGYTASTRNFSLTANYTRGHGNAAVILGNENYGVMDYLTPINTIALFAMLGINTASMTDNPFGPGIKFSINGKVYIAVPLLSSLIGGNFTQLTPLLNNNAGIEVQIGDFRYIVRLAKALAAAWDGSTKVASSDADDLFIAMIQCQFPTSAVKPGERLGKLAALANYPLVCREYVGGTIATRNIANNNITWLTPSTSGNYYVPFILELVE